MVFGLAEKRNRISRFSKKRASALKISAFIFLQAVLFMGDSKAQSADSALIKYSLFIPEKAWLHFDKPMYATGETVWFKAYLMEGALPALKSKTLYTDWTDEAGKLIYRSASPLLDGVTSGQFDIPADFKGRALHIRSYTRWMLNFDSSFLFEKNIPVISKTPVASKPIAPVASIQFFPEGGDAVAMLENKIAFKANDQYGRPVKVRGVILNSKNKMIDSLRTQHDGMGTFVIVPEPGETYIAKWVDEKKVAHTTPLPPIKQSGITLQVSPTGEKRHFIVRATKDIMALKPSLQIIGTMNNELVFRIKKQVSETDIKGVIPASDLLSGILTITVLDDQWKPVAERITYIDNRDYFFQPEMEVSHWGLNKRARNELTISVPDSLAATLSIAVTDLGIDHDTSNNIISQLMLKGDLKGDVFAPAYYFADNSIKAKQNLDLVMLTNGWRRFRWDEIAQGKLPAIKYERDTTYLSLSGRLLGLSPERLRENLTLIMIVKPKSGEGGISMLSVKHDGSFSDPQKVLFDTTEISYGLYKAQGNTSNLSAQFLENKMPPLRNNQKAVNANSDTAGAARQAAYAAEAAALLKKEEGVMLENVTVQARTKSNLEIMDEKYASGLFQGGHGHSFDLVNDPFAASAMNIFTFLQGRVAGLQVNGATSNPSLSWRGGSPQLFLNEMPVDVDMVSSIPVNDVAYIKVLPPPFIGASGGGANGAIAIYTRKGGDVKPDPAKKSPSSTVIGYTAIRQFYAPNYNAFKKENDTKDLRTTLYWNPNLALSPGANSVKISFFNNDISSAFRVVIEGMTMDGRLAHIEQIME